MSLFERIFDAFSSRPEAAPKKRHIVPETTRTRIVMWCEEIFANRSGYAGARDYTDQMWAEIRRFLQYRHGQGQLSEHAKSVREDVIRYIMTCHGEQFLDFLEDVFKVECFFHVGMPDDEVVTQMNELLRKDDLPYFVTDFVKEEGKEMFHGSMHSVIRTVAFPKVIMRESEILHANAVRPVLELLRRPEYANANSEYLAALQDYRKNDLGDCLTKCGSAFESVLKIICQRKGWTYQQKDTASTLVKTFIAETGLESYFEQMLMTTAILRNKLSASHGAGTQPKQVRRHTALYALNITASTILFVVDETQ